MDIYGVPRHYVNRAGGFPWKVSDNVIHVVVAAVQYAWDLILANPSNELEASQPGLPLEDIFSDAICNILEGLLGQSPSPVAGFDSNLFKAIYRGDHLGNYSGTSINKKPDFIIRLAAGPLTSAARFVGIFIESKIVQSTSPLSLYTDDGLLRFVNGDYAWAMQTGLMLAYQRAGKGRPLTELTTRLQKTQHLGTRRQPAGPTPAPAKKKAKKPTLPAPLLTYRTAPDMVRSEHERVWCYTSDNQSPGDINVWHVWNLPMPVGY